MTSFEKFAGRLDRCHAAGGPPGASFGGRLGESRRLELHVQVLQLLTATHCVLLPDLSKRDGWCD
jgi:hypothetical protein